KGLRGKRIAVIGDNSYHWMLAYFATLFGGSVIVPLDRELLKPEILNLLGKAKCEAVFHDQKYAEAVGESGLAHTFLMRKYYKADGGTCRALDIGNAPSPAQIQAARELVPDPDALACVMFTSGTTGEAKGVMHSQYTLGKNVLDIHESLGFQNTDSTVSILPMHHCFESRMGVSAELTQGVRIAIGDGLKYIYKNLAEAEATVLLCVPLLLESLHRRVWNNAEKTGTSESLKKRARELREKRFELMKTGANNDGAIFELGKKMFAEERKLLGGHLRKVFTGAAAIDPALINGVQDIGIKVQQGYGMTEMSALLSSTRHYEDNYLKPASVGRPVASAVFKIDAPDADGIGEILIKGPTAMLGYLDRPELTASVFQDGWYRTGDYGYLDDEGWAFITGRKMNMIVTRTGKNIFPEELEAELAKSKLIGELMVHGSEDKSGNILVSLQVRPNMEEVVRVLGKADPDYNEIFQAVAAEVKAFNATVPNYKRIRNLVIRKEEFIKTPTGKIRRKMNII
ncbi:MAG: AMP-binding protein, partial [Opitutaceae bacterium]|nr:AMP-binding protein [Opitutaceae bacterium]